MHSVNQDQPDKDDKGTDNNKPSGIGVCASEQLGTASAVAQHASPSVALKVTKPSRSPSPESPALAPGVSETLLAAFSEPASKTAGDALTPGMDGTLASQAREKPLVDVIPEVSVQDEVDYK